MQHNVTDHLNIRAVYFTTTSVRRILQLTQQGLSSFEVLFMEVARVQIVRVTHPGSCGRSLPLVPFHCFLYEYFMGCLATLPQSYDYLSEVQSHLCEYGSM